MGHTPPRTCDAHVRTSANCTLSLTPSCLPSHPLSPFSRGRTHAVSAEQAASTVPLTVDVHGDTVVHKAGYGVVQSQASADSQAAEGLTKITLQQIVAGEVPLVRALSFLLRLGSSSLNCPVEIEFALDLRKSSSDRHKLTVLQIRPQVLMRCG